MIMVSIACWHGVIADIGGYDVCGQRDQIGLGLRILCGHDPVQAVGDSYGRQ
jgi:hypothetical protein